MSITTGTVLKVVASFLWTDGNVAQNVFNAVVTGAGGPWDEADIVEDAKDWLALMYANLTALISNEMDGNECIVYEYDPVDDDWDEVGSISWTWDPTGTSEELPRGVAGLVRLWTTDPDVQGKKYIPGLMESGLVDGLYNAAVIAGLIAFGDDWQADYLGTETGADWAPGIWSVAGTVFKASVDHYATSTIPAYQRRRKRNVGI